MYDSEIRQQGGISLLYQSELPPEAHWDLALEFQRLASVRAEHRIEKEKALERLTKESADAFRAEIGEDNFNRYQELRERCVRNMGALRRRAIQDPTLLEEFDAQRRANDDEIRKFATEAGVDLGKIRDLWKHYADNVAALITEDISEEETVPRAELSALSRSEWIEKTPPFIDKYSDISFYKSSPYSDPAEHRREDDVRFYQDDGYIHHDTRIKAWDTTNKDRLYYESYVALAHILKLPHRCAVLYVVPVFENKDSWVDWSTYNEWGFSSYTLHFECKAYVRLTPVWNAPGIKTQERYMKLANSDGDDGELELEEDVLESVGSVSLPRPYQFWSPGEELTPSVVPRFSGPFPTGSYVGIWGG
jgi:hypothetical protein